MEKETASGNEIAKGFSQIGCFADGSDIFLPVNIFRNGASSLESISKYLKDAVGMKYCEIADILNRDDSTIWGAYRGANEKLETEFDAEESSIKIPIFVFRDRSLSVLEALTEYLKDELNIKYCRIAALLRKDQRTIWTVYSRAKKKRKKAANTEKNA